MRRQLPVPHLFSRIARRANFTLLVLCAAAACGASIRSAHAQSALDGFDPNANGSVSAIAVQPDGKILIGGSFTTLAPNGGPPVARNRIARLNPDGTLDAAFNPNADNDVYVIALQPDGKVLIGGAFTSVAGQSRTHLARLDAATGQPDLFNPSPNSTVYALALQADGSILVGGGFTSIGGQTRSSLARLDRTTGLADSFSVNANGLVRRIIVQSDGKILVCGGFLAIGGETRKHIARLDPTSGRADSFNPNANSFVMTIALQADGKVLAGGAFSGANSIGGQSRKYIARLDATTGLADSFDPHASIEINRIVVQPDGKILVGSPVGFSNTIGGQVREGIARLDPATGLVDSFNPGTNESVVEIAMQQDGKILIGGRFNGVNSVDGQTRNRIARLGADGRVDNTLENPSIHRGSDITKVVRAIALQPDGKILIGGLFTSVLGVERNHIARLNADGTLDVAFNPNVTTPGYSASSGDGVASIVVQPDGKILVGGYFVRVGGQERRHLARLDPITGSADSFNPDPDSAIHSIALTADGKLLVGGQFASIGGQVRSNLARLSTTTGLADSFNPRPNSIVTAIVVDREGKLLIAGGFTIVDAQFRNRIARLDPLTGAADAFNPNANGPVDVLAIQADGKVLAAGGFNYMSGQPRSQIARIDPVSGLADAFNPGTNGWVYSIAVQPDGKILLGGQFSTIGGQDRAYIARLDPATGVPDSFNANVDEFVEAIALQPDGKMLVGGTFANVGGLPRNLLARLSNDTAALQNLNVTPGAVSWTRDGSGPLLERVMFEGSSNGVTYSSLGEARASGSQWTLSGLSLPLAQDVYLRATGVYRTAQSNASQSITQSVRHAFLSSPLQLATAVSRKTHGDAGEFDIELPLGGAPGVECRSSGGAHTLVFTFSNEIASGNASVTAGTGTMSEAPSFVGNTMLVRLAGVTDAQKVTVTLAGITDSSGQALPDIAVNMNMLVGDINSSKTVNASDIGAVKAQSGTPVTAANFRADVAVSGAITASDIGLVKSRSGQSVP